MKSREGERNETRERRKWKGGGRERKGMGHTGKKGEEAWGQREEVRRKP